MPEQTTQTQPEPKIDEFMSPESSGIHGAVYYKDTKVIRVRFKNHLGQVTSNYDYFPADAAMWESFKTAKSKGQFHAARLKNNKKLKVQKVS